MKYSRSDISNSGRELSKANMGLNPAYYKKMLKMVKGVIERRNKALKFEIDEEKDERWKIKLHCDLGFAGEKEN